MQQEYKSEDINIPQNQDNKTENIIEESNPLADDEQKAVEKRSSRVIFALLGMIALIVIIVTCGTIFVGNRKSLAIIGDEDLKTALASCNVLKEYMLRSSRDPSKLSDVAVCLNGNKVFSVPNPVILLNFPPKNCEWMPDLVFASSKQFYDKQISLGCK